MYEYATPLEEHIYHGPAVLREECSICGAGIVDGDTIYVDPDGMVVCSDCAH